MQQAWPPYSMVESSIDELVWAGVRRVVFVCVFKLLTALYTTQGHAA